MFKKLIFFIVLLTATSLVVSKKSYLISKNKLTFLEAYVACIRVGTQLATEKSSNDTEAINKEIIKQNVQTHIHFIGGYQKENSDFYEDEWIWVNNGDPIINYENWLNNEKDNSNNCIVKGSVISVNGQWSTENCDVPNYFICESLSDSDDD